MSIYQPKPTYYRITWDLSSPTDYTSVGGITPFNSQQYKNIVALSGTESAPSMSTGDILLLNNVEIGPFNSADTLSDIVDRFNLKTYYTNVMASENWTGYLTLQSVSPVDAPILLANKVGTPCADLGLPLGNFSWYSPIYGGSFTTLTNGQSVVINGITITFATGGLDVAGACAKINQSTKLTGVVATPWTNKIQLNSLDGSPVFFGSPGSGTATTDLGFAINTAYGGAMSFAEALEIERGNIRWKGIATTLETNLTAFSYTMITMTGSTTDGNQLPETVSWTLGVENADHVYCKTAAGEPEGAGVILTGTAALKRLVARALISSWAENRNVYNNSLTVRGAYALRENTVVVEYVTASALDNLADIATIEGNITVAMIAYA